MILYQGSNMIIESPKIIQTDTGRDFGFGFYTTDIREQAVRWAIRKANMAKRVNAADIPYISIFEFDESNYQRLKCKHFGDPSLDWLEMICTCRSDIAYSHGYDIVTGKIANDNVGETVVYVLRGIMRKEDAIERLKFEKINNQICFNTEAALKCLHYVKHEDCR